MADLYGNNNNNNRSSSSVESEEMSSFLQNLVHNSGNTPPFNSKNNKMSSFFADPAETGPNPFCSDSDPITSRRNVMYSSTTNTHHHHDADDFDFGCEEPEVPANSVPPRSSKRTRAAEIHNLSEKRRRSRINEKLKALQNLIPNSNKTDKASMLDEAIEYLKQLQLQVQMLTMRNGLGLSPVYLPETLPSLQLSQRGVDYDEGNILMNANRRDSVSTDPKFSAQGELFMSNPAQRNQPIVIPSITNINNSEASYGLEPSIPESI